MGMWTLEGVSGSTSDFTTSQLFGTNVMVTFRLRYRPATIGTFQETPRAESGRTYRQSPEATAAANSDG